MASRIPIENIYYLLSYSWNKLDEKEKISIALEDCKTPIDLLAKILLNFCNILLKRGLDSYYVEQKETIAGIKGKLDFSDTIKSNLLMKGKSACSYDEFSSDILLNQILVSTLYLLLKVDNLDEKIKKDIFSCILRFPKMKSIRLRASLFNSIRLNRNNRFYSLGLNVSQMIYENSFPSENPGHFFFKDFIRDDKKMAALFESFVRNFYRMEQSKYKINRDYIDWQLKAEDAESLSYLPRMETDITLRSLNEKIIIDTKYYSETLTNNGYSSGKIHTQNLYQLFSYIINQRNIKEKNSIVAKGILLYPTVTKELDLEYLYEGHKVQIKTVNLNQSWNKIASRLLNILE